MVNGEITGHGNEKRENDNDEHEEQTEDEQEAGEDCEGWKVEDDEKGSRYCNKLMSQRHVAD